MSQVVWVILPLMACFKFLRQFCVKIDAQGFKWSKPITMEKLGILIYQKNFELKCSQLFSSCGINQKAFVVGINPLLLLSDPFMDCTVDKCQIVNMCRSLKLFTKSIWHSLEWRLFFERKTSSHFEIYLQCGTILLAKSKHSKWYYYAFH